MSKQGKGLWSRLEEVPREVLYLLIFLAIIVPTVSPIGLAVPISDEAKAWYNTVDKLPAGSAVFVDFGYSGGGEPELGPMAVATYHHMLRRKVKVIAMSTSLEGPLLFERVMAEVGPEKYGAKYGVDYVHIGYIAGTETAMAAVGKDLRATTSTDYKKVSLDQYPIMAGIKDASSFQLLICFTTGGDQSEGWVRQWVTPYKTPYIANVLALMIPTMLPYRRAGQLLSLTAGAQAGEVELLIKVPGRGIKSADVISMCHILMVAFVILGNIAYYGRKASGG